MCYWIYKRNKFGNGCVFHKIKCVFDLNIEKKTRKKIKLMKIESRNIRHMIDEENFWVVQLKFVYCETQKFQENFSPLKDDVLANNEFQNIDDWEILLKEKKKYYGFMC